MMNRADIARRRSLLIIVLLFVALFCAACARPTSSTLPPSSSNDSDTLPSNDNESSVQPNTAEAIDTSLYSDIPDSMFPIPMRNGVVIPFDDVGFPEEGTTGITYVFNDPSVMEQYSRHLKAAGFENQGSIETIGIDSWWRLDRSEDGATLIVEMWGGDSFAMVMDVNYLNP